MNPTIFYQTKIGEAGTMFFPILNKENLKTFYPEINFEEVKLTANFREIGTFPTETVFAATMDDFSTDGKSIFKITNIRPVHFRSTIFADDKEDPKNISEETLLEYFGNKMDQCEYSHIAQEKKFILDLAKQYKDALGYEFKNLKDILEPKVPETIEEVDANDRMSLHDWIKIKYKKPSISECGFHIESSLWYRLVRNILRSKNTILIGPTGSGKTEIVQLISQRMGLAMNVQDMGTVQDAQSALLGVHRLDESNRSIFDPAPFVGHIQKESIILLDEMNR